MTVEEIAAENQRYIVKVFGWMFLAMIVTGGTASYTAGHPEIQQFFGNPFAFIGLVIVQFVSVGILVGLVNRMSALVATVIFFIYSIVFGLTLSFIFVVYTEESIASTFFITAGTFGVMSIWGFFTKTDLTRWGNLLMMGVVGLIITSLVNQFLLHSGTLYWVTSCVGVLIFVGLTAYDKQKIKNSNIIGNEGSEDDHKESIIGALILYLDFINLFLYLLRIFGRRK